MFKKAIKKIYVPFCFFSLSMVCFPQTSALEPARRILLINSYHCGFTWTDGIVQGVREAFSQAIPKATDYELSVEFMDTKRIAPTKSYLDKLQDLYGSKYADRKPDVVIVSDNDALNFLADRHSKLFSGVPVVFCGVNNFDPAMLKGDELITGVAEEPDIAGTIRMARQIRRDTKMLAFICDQTTTGIKNREAAEKAVKAMDKPLPTLFLSGADLSQAELIEKLKKLPANSAVVLLDFFADRTGAYQRMESFVPAICAASEGPVYSHTDLYFGLGVVGGSINLGNRHGKASAELALKLLGGSRVADIPAASAGQASFEADWQALKRWNLNPDNLPKGTELAGKPFSVYERYAALIWAIAVSFSVLSVLVLVLALNIVRRRRLERALRESELHARAIFDSVNEAIFVQAPASGAILDVNDSMTRLYGYTKEEARTKTVRELSAETHQQHDERIRDFLGRVAAGEEVKQEWLAKAKDGSLFWVEVALRSMDVLGEKRVLVSCRDIGERKAAAEELQRSLREKEILLKEIHHRVKNNFQIINSLLDLQEAATKNKDFKESLKEPRARIYAMALVHERLYQSVSLSSIDFGTYVEELSYELYSAYETDPERTRIELHVEPVELDIDRAIPCGLILNELVTNALKYAFPKNSGKSGTIRIALYRSDLDITLSVEDDGVGCRFEARADDSSSLGVTLVNLLTAQLGGRFTMSGEGGVKAFLSIPLLGKKQDSASS